MTTEIIVFIAAILLGIVMYWRESKNNSLYRFGNKLTHTKELQLAKESRKGFLHEQVFLMRLVWIAAGFLLIAIGVSVLTPINIFMVEYFISAIVGTLIGTYIASAFFVTKKGLTKDNLIDAVKKSKDFIEDLADVKEDEEPEAIENAQEQAQEFKEAKAYEPEPEPKKSARDRLKDKGMIK